MVAIISGSINAAGNIQFLRLVGQVRIEHIIVIAHGFADNEIRFLVHIAVRVSKIRQTVLAEFLAGLVVFVISVTTGIVECRAPCQAVRKLVSIVELDMVLRVIVSIIVIIVHSAIGIIELTCRVVLSVRLVHLRVNAVPGDAGMLVAHQVGQFQ